MLKGASYAIGQVLTRLQKGLQRMKAVIYARQSSGDEEQSASVEQQIENCKHLAEQNNISVVGIYQDLNISGKSYPDTTEAIALATVDAAYKSWVESTYLKSQRYRKGLAAVLSALKGVDYVLLDDFTRLMRPLANSYLESHIIQKLRMANVKVWCVRGGISDLSNFADNLVATLISQINANQIEIQRQKTLDALKKLRDSGYRPTGGSLTGYRFVGKHTFEIVPEEAELVRTAFEMGIRGVSYARICRTLNKKAGYIKFNHTFLKQLFSRPEYAGYQYNTKGELIPSNSFKDIPLITLYQFNQVQTRITKSRVQNHDRKNIYAFTGLCYCGYCKQKMTVLSTRTFLQAKQRVIARFFSCDNRNNYEYNSDCSLARIRYKYETNTSNPEMPRKPVTASDLNNLLVPTKLKPQGLHESLMPLIALQLIKEKRELMVSSEIQKQIQELELRKKSRIDFERRLGEMLFNGTIDESQFEIMINESRKDKEEISKQIIELTSRNCVNHKEAEKELSRILYILRLKHIDPNLYKKYAQKLISRITVFARYITVDFVNGKGFTLERLAIKNIRSLPDWTLEIKEEKALIRYYYKSFYNGDQTVRLLYKDDFMEISAVGENPKIIDSPSKLKRRAQKAMAIRKRRNE